MRRRTAWGVWAIGVVLLSTTYPAASGPVGMRPIGRLPIGPAERVVVDRHSRSLVSMGNENGVLTLKVFDGERLALVRRSAFPGYAVAIGRGIPIVHALDEESHVLYVVAYPSSEEGLVGVDPRLLAIAVPSLALRSARPLSAFPPGLLIVGMNSFAPLRRLYLVAHPVSSSIALAGSYGVHVAEVDPATGGGTWPAPYAVPHCQAALTNTSQAAVARLSEPAKVFVGCGTGRLVATSEPGFPGVAAIDVRAPARPTTRLHPVAGGYSPGDSFYDAEGGRLLLVGQAPDRAAQAAWVFDVRREVWAGVIAAEEQDVAAAGVDGATGRIYLGTFKELFVGNARGLRPPQPTVVPIPTWPAPIVPFTFGRRVLIPWLSATRSVWAVFEDLIPAHRPETPFDYDHLTDGVREQPGRSVVEFGADAQAFGVRVLQVAGVNGVLQNVFAHPSGNSYWALLGSPGGLRDGSRDLYMARVTRAHLSHQEATALAIAADRDRNTDSDYYTVTRGGIWPFGPAHCADLGAGSTHTSAESSEVGCDQKGGRVTALVSHEAVRVAEIASIGSSMSGTSIRRDPKLGVALTVQAEARDVTLGGVVHIGRIVSESFVSAYGRPGTARAKYIRRFEHVSAPGFLCALECDPEAVVGAIGAALPPAFVVELPGYEVVGTPKGARAAAVREEWQHREDEVLLDQDRTELQIPALRVMHVADNSVRSRTVIDLAATMGNATYFVSLLEPPSAKASRELPLVGSIGPSTTAVGEFRARGPSPVAKDISPLVPAVPRASARSLVRGVAIFYGGWRGVVRTAALWILLAVPLLLAWGRRHLLTPGRQ